MKEIYILYKSDSWHSSDSMEVVFLGSSVENCCLAARKNGATNEQVTQLRDIRQSQCTSDSDYEYQIDHWNIDKF